MSQVQLDLALGLEAFQAKVAAAEGMLLRLKSKTDAGVSLKTFLDTSSLHSQLQAAQKALSSGATTIKVGTEFYKTGSQYAISATKLKTQIIDPIQQKVASDRKYTIKIGTELTFNQDSLKQIDAIVAKAKASLESVQRSTAETRQQLNKLTMTPGQGGLDPAALRRLQTAAAQAGIKTAATGATELRKELRDAFSKASDDAIDGLARGLTSKTSTVIDASTKTGKDLIKALKKSLGIASPSKETRKLGEASADGFGQGFIGGMVDWERQMARAIRQSIGNAFQQGLARDAAARGALADMGRDAAQVISTSLGKALKQGLASSVAPALKGGLLGATGGMATGGLVGGLGAAGSAIKQAVMPSMLTFGYGSVPQKLGMLGHGAASLASGGASDAFNTFLQNSLDSVVQAAMSTGGQGALVGAAGVAGVAGAAGLARGATGSLIGQAIDSVKNRILGQGAQRATQQAEQLDAGSNALASAAPDPQAARAIERSMQRFEVKLTDAQYNLLEYALALDNIDTGTFGEKWSQLGGALSKKMELSAEQLSALASEIDTNPVLDDIDSYGDELGKSATRIVANIKAKFADLTRQLNESGGQSAAGLTAASISRDLMSGALQDSAALAQAGGTSGAVTAPVENANSMFGALREGTVTVAKALASFAKELTPGRIQERILEIAWNMDQAAQEFAEAKRNTQVLAGKIRNTWDAFSNDVRPHLLPPEPVAGTGLVRQQRLQLGDVVGRTGFGFSGQAYGVEGGLIGPADIDQGRGYLEQTRRALEPIAGRPGEWRIVDEVNGVWQRIKTNSELAEERMALIAQSMTVAEDRFNRTWTDRDGIGAFNPFDQAFYRPTRPPQQPPSGGDGSYGGNRFGRPDPAGALALRNVPVELFASFREAERLLALVEQRLGAVGRAFDTLKVKSQIQADQEVRKLSVSLRAVELAFQKGEVSASDMRAAVYGMQREMAGLDAQTAEVQNLARAFENLGGMASQAREAIERQRNLDVAFVQDVTRNPDGSLSREGRKAGNLRDIQQLEYANDLVRGMQSASGFGGFRGREIGNETLIKALQRTNLREYINQFDELSAGMLETARNAGTYRSVQEALTVEFENASRAYRVLNGTAREGETITHLARNAWGTILDDFQNLVPQLLVFAVAYNLILQRVMATPGAVIQAAAAFDRLETSISAYLSATRGMGDTSKVIDELRSIALDLGIGFEKAASSYLRFAAATQGTPLEGRETEITRTLATAGRNQGLAGEQIDRASIALTQILSKGRVQSEELRGQLAEQLPGALQIAARAFGVTTKELYQMVEAGQIAGDEFVGRFIKQLKAEGASVNQLAGSFSSVSEQLGSSIESISAAAGRPLLAPLTLSMQMLNGVIKTLIPLAPVVTGLFVVLGAQALKAALNHVPLGRELMGAVRGMFAARDAAEGYTAGLVKLTGIAQVAARVLSTVGKAALIGIAFEAMAGTIRYLKGEVGSLGDELKKVNKIADGGTGGGLNSLQKLLGNFNVAQNISDRVTFFDAAKIGESADKATSKILGSQKKIKASIEEVNRIDRALYQERLKRDQAEAARDQKGAEEAVERIKRLEKERTEVKFEYSAEDAQIQLDALKAAEQATQKLIDRQEALGNKPFVEQRELTRLQQIREEFEKTARAAGLLDRNLLRIQSLGALQSRLKAEQEILASQDVNSAGYREQQRKVVGLQQAITDQQLLPQERALKTQESVLRRMSAELKVQENVQRIKLGLIESERRALEASLSLEQTRGRLREAVSQRRVDVASALGAPEEQLAAEVQLRRVREANQTKELSMQGRLLSKDRERINIETSLQKTQVEIQTEQLKINKQMLQLERLKLENAAKTGGVAKDLVRQYYLQMWQIDKTVKATDKLIGQEGQLIESVEQKGAAELSVLDIKQQELDIQRQILGVSSLTAQQVEQIKAAKQDIANKEAAALATIEAANAVLQRQQQAIESQLEATRATVDAQRERARLAEENARNEMALVDRLLELQQGRNEGGVFERMAKASLLGAAGEQQAYDIAARRMELQRQIQEQQLRQKQLELDFKKRELEAEKALNELKTKGLKIANEEAKMRLRRQLEEARLTLETLGGGRSTSQNQLLKQITDAQLALGGYNPEVAGNSVNANAANLVGQTRSRLEQDRLIRDMERRQSEVYDERFKALDNLIGNEQKQLEIQQQLFELDAAQWFGQFLDKSTQLGRTLSVLTDGLSEFRSSVSQAFGEAITNGASASEAIADASTALAGKVVTGLFDELLLKPLEANFFAGLSKIFGFEAPRSEQVQTKESVDAVNQSVGVLQDVVRESTTAVVNAIKGIAKPTTATPTYRAPDNAGLATAVAGAVYRQGGIGPNGPNTYGPHFDIARVDGGYFDRNALDPYVRVNGQPLSSGYTVPGPTGGSFGASRDGGNRSHQAWDYAFGGAAALSLTGGAQWQGSSPTAWGDRAVFMTPDGTVYRIIHGTLTGGAAAPAAPAVPPAVMSPLPSVNQSSPGLGDQSSLGIGDQFLNLLGNESGYEDIAGLQPLPLQKMLQQIGRPLTVLYKRIEEAKNSVYPYSLSGVARQVSADAFKGLQGMNGAIYGILGDISDYLNEGQLEVLRKGIKEQLDLGVSPSAIKMEVTGGNIRTGRANVEEAVRSLVDELSGSGTRPFDDRFFNQLQDQPRIIPGVESKFDGAMLPSQGFDISKLTREYQSVASASTEVLQVVPKFKQLEQGTQQLNEAVTGGAAAISKTKAAAANTPSAFTQLNTTLGSVVGLLGGIGIGMAGAQQIQQGGTYNTLMGLAGVFGGIASVASAFGSIGGMFGGGAAGPARLSQGIDVPLSQMPIGMRAMGGPVAARRPYIVGEEGPELFIPSVNGSILSNGLTEARGALDDMDRLAAAEDAAAAEQGSLTAMSAGVTARKGSSDNPRHELSMVLQDSRGALDNIIRIARDREATGLVPTAATATTGINGEVMQPAALMAEHQASSEAGGKAAEGADGEGIAASSPAAGAESFKALADARDALAGILDGRGGIDGAGDGSDGQSNLVTNADRRAATSAAQLPEQLRYVLKDSRGAIDNIRRVIRERESVASTSTATTNEKESLLSREASTIREILSGIGGSGESDPAPMDAGSQQVMANAVSAARDALNERVIGGDGGESGTRDGAITSSREVIERIAESRNPLDSNRSAIASSNSVERINTKESSALTQAKETTNSMMALSQTRQMLNSVSTVNKERSVEKAIETTTTGSTKPIDVRYESQVINNVEYVTAEQHRKGIAEAAERGRALTLSALKNSVKARRQVGM